MYDSLNNVNFKEVLCPRSQIFLPTPILKGATGTQSFFYGSCPKMLRSGNAHGCSNRRTLPDVYFFAGFQGEKVNIVYFSAGFEAFKYTSQRSGAFTVLDPQAENIRFQKRTVSEASPALAFSERMISVKIGHFSLPRTVPAPVSSEGLQDLHCLSECALGM